MQPRYSNYAIGFIFAMSISTATPAPLPISWSASSFSTAVEGLVTGYTEHIQKEYGTVPNMLGDGKMVGLVNVQVGSEGTDVYIGGKRIGL
ncbi:uncharacterized protein LY89DRAFT_787078 [Mollisia scopiformis]|uniref:Uncharacterized protein n=1 Tax=Mollisia scopiformis TaxID=149040 RepID=A0A194WSL3_MOLSC|nr:uncharacterized protein LY89DRAFT_787078 [Mollisia scopiformis]KUJ10674.1 hypothetical protein LY89DRAFT_787078 [Mollisia scopiformis]